jgi:hypothetical protein
MPTYIPGSSRDPTYAPPEAVAGRISANGITAVADFFDTRTDSVSGSDPASLITACLEAGKQALLVDSDDLPLAFFDLSTGIAGAFVQRLRNYGVRAAMVVPNRTVYSQSFQEFAAEADRDSLFRFVASREDAIRWLAL